MSAIDQTVQNACLSTTVDERALLTIPYDAFMHMVMANSMNSKHIVPYIKSHDIRAMKWPPDPHVCDILMHFYVARAYLRMVYVNSMSSYHVAKLPYRTLKCNTGRRALLASARC